MDPNCRLSGKIDKLKKKTALFWAPALKPQCKWKQSFRQSSKTNHVKKNKKTGLNTHEVIREMTHTREHRWAKSDQRDRGNKAQHDAHGTRGKKQTLRQKLGRTNVTQTRSKNGRPNRHRPDAGTQAYNIANDENYEHRIWTRTRTENIQQKLKVWKAGSWNCPPN